MGLVIRLAGVCGLVECFGGGFIKWLCPVDVALIKLFELLDLFGGR